jgi:hypothetical protein
MQLEYDLDHRVSFDGVSLKQRWLLSPFFHRIQRRFGELAALLNYLGVSHTPVLAYSCEN